MGNWNHTVCLLYDERNGLLSITQFQLGRGQWKL